MEDRLTIRAADDGAWHHLLDAPRAAFHQRPEWLAVLDQGFRGESLVPCLDRGDEVVAALPAYLLRAGPFRILYSGIPYGGPVGEEREVAALWEALRARGRTLPADQVRHVPYAARETDPGWARRASRTEITEIPLTGRTADEWWRGIGKGARQSVRRSRKNGVKVSPPGFPPDPDHLYTLYAETVRRKGAARKYTRRYFHALAHHPDASIRLAMLDDVPVAGIALLRDGATTHYLHAASSGAGRESLANDMLVYEAVTEAIRAGCASFDLGASRPDDRGLIAFKAKWSGVARTGEVRVLPIRRVRSALSEVARRLAR
jgi:hypothetical protein